MNQVQILIMTSSSDGQLTAYRDANLMHVTEGYRSGVELASKGTIDRTKELKEGHRRELAIDE